MGSFWLEYEQSGEVQTFPFDEANITIGRDQSSDFVLDHPTVSRQHALIVDDGGGQFRLVVLSQGGLTAVDGEKIADETTLYDGSEVYLGKLVFRFRAEQAPARNQNRNRNARSRQGDQSVRRGGGGRPEQRTSGPDGGAAATGSGAASGSSEAGGTPDDSQSSSTVDSSSRAGVKSWDEIAQSAEVDDEQDGDNGSKSAGAGDEIGTGIGGDNKGEIEETDPKIVGLGGVLIALFMVYFMWPSGGGGGQQKADPLEETDPSELVEVECLSEKECTKKAESAYTLGVDYLEKQDSEVANLFKGYIRLLEAQQFLEMAETDQTPAKLSDLQNRIDEADAKLKEIFRNYKVKYRSAEKNGQSREMADALNTIQRYFPNKRAPEYQWAQDRILKMKKRGNYPAGF